MRFSHFFVDRPIFATVLSLVLIIIGSVAYTQLPVAQYPNVAMKATGAPSYSGHAYPFRDIHDNLHRLYDAFGPARFFWGTDITRMPCPWRQCVTLFTEELPWLQGRDLELVMGRAVCDWLGWKR